MKIKITYLNTYIQNPPHKKHPFKLMDLLALHDLYVYVYVYICRCEKREKETYVCRRGERMIVLFSKKKND